MFIIPSEVWTTNTSSGSAKSLILLDLEKQKKRKLLAVKLKLCTSLCLKLVCLRISSWSLFISLYKCLLPQAGGYILILLAISSNF
uniref:Uncharacterized protein n=1 Tax=Arundo donax TaxID=35708 RepID=A0A0A8Z6Q7_ARUDO